jgi:hypothetical protein
MVKMVRGPLLVKQFGIESAVPSHIKVFHLVRAPWAVFFSQLSAGWFTDPAMPFLAQLPPGVDINVFNMDRICKHMLVNHEILVGRPASSQLIVKYETLKSDFAGEVRRLFGFLDLPMTNIMLSQARDLTLHKYAQFNTIVETELTVDDAWQIAVKLASCQGVMRLYEY